jgi:hypothetical protein
MLIFPLMSARRLRAIRVTRFIAGMCILNCQRSEEQSNGLLAFCKDATTENQIMVLSLRKSAPTDFYGDDLRVAMQRLPDVTNS